MRLFVTHHAQESLLYKGVYIDIVLRGRLLPRCTRPTCSSAAALSSVHDSGGAGVMEQLASRCCRHSRTSSVICSTLRARSRLLWSLVVWLAA